MNISITERLCWGLRELSVASGLSIGLLRKEISEGRLGTRRVGRRVIVTQEQWSQFLKAKNPTNAAKDNQARAFGRELLPSASTPREVKP